MAILQEGIGIAVPCESIGSEVLEVYGGEIAAECIGHSIAGDTLGLVVSGIGSQATHVTWWAWNSNDGMAWNSEELIGL